MDFVSIFVKSRKINDGVLVIVDRLTKFIIFLPIKMTNLVDKVAKLYVDEVFRLHEVLVIIVFY